MTDKQQDAKTEWVMVPRVPTFAMRPYVAGASHEDVNGNYAAMLAAAPKTEAQGVDLLVARLTNALTMYDQHRTTMQSLASSVGDFLRDYRALSTPASHDAQHREAAGALAGEGWRLVGEERVPAGVRPVEVTDHPLSPPMVTVWKTRYRWERVENAVTEDKFPPGHAPVEPVCEDCDGYQQEGVFCLSCGMDYSGVAALSAAPAPAQQPAVVGDGVPLRVFSAGGWTYDGTGQTFSHEDMDEAAFVVYRDLAALTPAATPGEGSAK